MANFHPLKVTGLRPTTENAVVVSLTPQNPQKFSFVQGQYLTFRRKFAGQELRRSYSICSAVDDGTLEVAIKRVDDGAFSSWANDNLRVGDTIDAMAPSGNFHHAIEPNAQKHYLAIAIGSGITPILSIVRTVLAKEPRSKITLVYANRSVGSIMFRDELEDLKNLHMGRLALFHILKQDATDIDLLTGRLDAQKCDAIFTSAVDLQNVDLTFICGPKSAMETIVESLERHDFPRNRVKYELFGAQPGRLKGQIRKLAQRSDAEVGELTSIINGESRSFPIQQDQSILQAAILHNADPPFACTAGVCSTCKAKVVKGKVEMIANHALEDYEVERGYVLTCQSYPKSPQIVVDYDQ